MSLNAIGANSFQTLPHSHEEVVPIWSATHKAHSIIPSKLIDLTIGYYENKGELNVADDFRKNNTHFHNVRADRPNRQSVHKRGILADGQVIEVYSAKNTEVLRKKLIRDDSDESGDTAVNEAYDGAKETYELLNTVYKVKSIDNRHFPLWSTVHYSRNYANAFWDGDEMVYGDGDRKIFNRFTIAIDITGHEIGHGFTQERCGTAISKDGKPTGVDYEGEAGGINEGLSDILGMQVKQRSKNQTAEQSDWLIGAKLIRTYKGKTYALRSMSNPGTGFVDHPRLGTDSQIALYPDYLARAEKESVDPHDSSGIVNKAFYHASKKLGGFTWEKVGRVYFEAMPYLTFDETFEGIANKTIAAAQKLFGRGSAEEGAVIESWKVVQVLK